MKDLEEIINKSYKEKLKLLKTLLKDDFSTFLFVSNMYLTDKSVSVKDFNKLFEGGLKRNYKFNKQQND